MRTCYVGTLTIAEIRKKFRIPDDADLVVTVPFRDYDNRGGPLNLVEDIEGDGIVVSYERIT